MRTGTIQNAIAQGVSPFALCHMITRKIRTDHQPGQSFQNSIETVFEALSREEDTRNRIFRAAGQSTVFPAA